MTKRQAIRLICTALSLPLALGALEVTSRADAKTGGRAQAVRPPTPTIDPRAMDLLKQSAARLKSLPSFAVHADSTKDEVVYAGFKVKRTMTESVLVQKPNRMRAEVSGDQGRRVYVYDGKAVSLYTEPDNHYATIAAPPTLGGMLTDVPSRYDVQLPLADLLYMSVGEDLGQNATEAGVIGPSRVAGAECDHLAFRTNVADWQVWIDRDGRLPRKIVVTSRDLSTAPEYQAVLTWDTAPRVPANSFAFAPPPGALPMRLAAVDQTGTTTPPTPRPAPPSAKAKGGGGTK
jgi:hypothetical protein